MLLTKRLSGKKVSWSVKLRYVYCSGAGVGWLLNNVLHGKTPPRGSTIPFLTEKSTPSYTIEPLLTATSLQRPHFWQTVHALNLL